MSLSRLILLAFVSTGVLFSSALLSAETDQTEKVDIRNSYRELLTLFPEDRQGYGLDSFKEATEDQPMTYGLVLSAEAMRASVKGMEKGSPAFLESRRRVKKAARWLIDNRDLDGDGKPGWGLPQSWDAWGDGSENTPHQPYTITTSIVLGGLLDALQVPELYSDAERKEIRDVISAVVLRWCREVWSEGYGGGYFWYSPSKADEIFGINAPSMFLGSIVRVLDEQGDLLSPQKRALVRSRADSLAKAIVATVVLRDGEPFWLYAPLPNRMNRSSGNDVVHHAYILFGIERCRDWKDSRVSIPWTRQKAIASMDRFFADADPQNNRPERILENTQLESPGGPQARLWGAGYMLAFYANWADDARTERAFRLIKQNYGPFPHLHWIGADATCADKNVCYPRHAAHVLYGMAIAAFTSRPGHDPAAVCN